MVLQPNHSRRFLSQKYRLQPTFLFLALSLFYNELEYSVFAIFHDVNDVWRFPTLDGVNKLNFLLDLVKNFNLSRSCHVIFRKRRYTPILKTSSLLAIFARESMFLRHVAGLWRRSSALCVASDQDLGLLCRALFILEKFERASFFLELWKLK